MERHKKIIDTVEERVSSSNPSEIQKTPRMKEVEAKLGRPLRELLVDLYWKEGKFLDEVAETVGTHQTTCGDWMERLNIDRRTPSDAQQIVHQRKAACSDQEATGCALPLLERIIDFAVDGTFSIHLFCRESLLLLADRLHQFKSGVEGQDYWDREINEFMRYKGEWRKLRMQLYETRGGRCEYCTEELDKDDFHLHHVDYQHGDDPKYLRVVCPRDHSILTAYGESEGKRVILRNKIIRRGQECKNRLKEMLLGRDNGPVYFD